MATKFSEIYERTIFRITDSGLLKISADARETLFEKMLLSAANDFRLSCVKNLNNYSLEEKQFNEDLDDEIIEILALGISYYWVNRQTLNNELLRNVLYGKDYSTYSPANLLKEAHSLRDTLKREFFGQINAYSIRNGNLKSTST